MTLRTAELTTDWAFWDINIGLPGEENVFFFKYEGDIEAVQTAALTFLVIGTILTPFDLKGSLERCQKKSEVGWRLTFSILISLLEDLPQASINLIYISACGLGTGTGQYITVVSLLVSGVAILYSWRTVYKDVTQFFGNCNASAATKSRNRTSISAPAFHTKTRSNDERTTNSFGV